MSEHQSPIIDICNPDDLPSNVLVGPETIISGSDPFKRFYSTRIPGLAIGSHCSMIGTQFSVGTAGSVTIGDYCYFTSVVLLCEDSVEIGSHVVIGWNATISDADFHPLSPHERLADALALAPDGDIHSRPPFAKKPVVIEDDVWIGAGATILKGVRVQRGAWIEPGSVVTGDVPAETRAFGNPAQFE